MTAALAAGIALLHIFVFIGVMALYRFFYKKDQYKKQELLNFILTMFIVGTLGFFVANHFAFLSSDKTVVLAIGYTVIPITQFTVGLLSYPLVMLMKEKIEFKYPPIFLGIVASAPVSYVFASLFSSIYWGLLGENIYG